MTSNRNLMSPTDILTFIRIKEKIKNTAKISNKKYPAINKNSLNPLFSEFQEVFKFPGNREYRLGVDPWGNLEPHVYVRFSKDDI